MLMRSPRGGRVRRAMPAGARRQGDRRRRLDTQAQTRLRGFLLRGGALLVTTFSSVAGPGSPLWGLGSQERTVRVLAARLAALASFVRPRLARSRQRLVAASRALRFGQRRGLCDHLGAGF